MPTKIRLTRHGRKGKAYYHIVVADSRAPRDGRFIEQIGLYNPGTVPATIELDFEKAMHWLIKGAQPTDTCRAILSYKGVLYKNHLIKGVAKGAFTLEEAEVRFKAWLDEKEKKIQSKHESFERLKADDKKKRLEAENKIRETRATELAKKLAAQAEKSKEAVATEVTAETMTTEEPVAQAETPAPSEAQTQADTPVQEEPKVENQENQ
jgi:small subunit ribosomal protein S16